MCPECGRLTGLSHTIGTDRWWRSCPFCGWVGQDLVTRAAEREETEIKEIKRLVKRGLQH